MVCTHGRPAMAARAVRSLGDQPVDEVLVVDNAPPDDSTRKTLEARAPTARYLVEPVQGLDFARNRALREARGEVVAFLDDDAVAAPGWADAIGRIFASGPGVGACTARVEALRLDTPGQRLFEANGGYARGLEPIRLPADSGLRLHGRRAPLIAWAVSVGSGCSFAMRRSVALELGGFDVALDLGAKLPGGGDHDMLWRILQAGYEVVYTPDALAYHEHRDDADAVVGQLAGHQLGLVAFLTKTALTTRGRARISAIAFLLWRLVKPAVRLARRAVGRDPLPARALWRMWRSALAGGPAYFEARRIARARSETTPGGGLRP